MVGGRCIERGARGVVERVHKLDKRLPLWRDAEEGDGYVGGALHAPRPRQAQVADGSC